jgi:hypothetical protein
MRLDAVSVLVFDRARESDALFWFLILQGRDLMQCDSNSSSSRCVYNVYMFMYQLQCSDESSFFGIFFGFDC